MAFLQALASRGRSSYTLPDPCAGVARFLERLAARATRLADVERGDVVAYVAEFARNEVDGVVLGRAAGPVNHRVSVLALCALPAGEQCSRGLVCLGCGSAQLKKSAAPNFQRMLASHQAALERARGARERAGQLAARELEVQRVGSALRRAGDLDDDVAAAIEAA